MVAAAYGNEARPVTGSRAFCGGTGLVDLLCNFAQQPVQLIGPGSTAPGIIQCKWSFWGKGDI